MGIFHSILYVYHSNYDNFRIRIWTDFGVFGEAGRLSVDLGYSKEFMGFLTCLTRLNQHKPKMLNGCWGFNTFNVFFFFLKTCLNPDVGVLKQQLRGWTTGTIQGTLFQAQSNVTETTSSLTFASKVGRWSELWGVPHAQRCGAWGRKKIHWILEFFF